MKKECCYIQQLEKFSKKEYIKKNYSLENIKNFLSILNNPQDKLDNIIHITGTNGKGSVANYISKMLTNLGYKVGLYTSPHIFKVNERICINHRPISDKVLSFYLKKIFETQTKHCLKQLTYFEILTCVMFLYFSEQKNDFNVIEVGLGGKLDATNVVNKSLVSVITRVGFDHTEVLGETIKEIVLDKAEIIKPNSNCVLSNNCSEVKKIIETVCKQKNVNLKIFNKDFGIDNVRFESITKKIFFDYWGDKKIKNLQSFILSVSQPENIAVAVSVLELLKKIGKIKVLEISKIKSATKIVLPSRFEVVDINKLLKDKSIGNKKLIFDGSHNPDAIKNFVNTIKVFNYKNILLCFTMMKEKDYKSCIKILSLIKNRIKKVLVYRLPLSRVQNINFLYKEFLKYFDKKSVEKILTKPLMLKFIKKFVKNFNYTIFVGTFYAEKFFVGDKN